eukprot:4441541-Pyramimonas_sp.AAC.1
MPLSIMNAKARLAAHEASRARAQTGEAAQERHRGAGPPKTSEQPFMGGRREGLAASKPHEHGLARDGCVSVVHAR